MDLPQLADLELPDSTGKPRRLGDSRAERPVILVLASLPTPAAD